MTEAARTLSLFVHISASVVWFGGLLMLALLVVPELRRGLAGQPALNALLRRLRRRFALWGNLALALLLVTGLLQMTDDVNYTGLLQVGNRWSQALLIKHILIVVLALVGAALQLGVLPALERASLLIERDLGDAEAMARLQMRERRLTLLMVALAVLILAASAWLGVL
ncbi:MAG: CopD family protein [Chloroflexi bacterium]|nr:CopD family protein [Chloroflexota bacterium]MCY4246195.1 CopD family protein [Chloroflexota bacterium]